MVARLNSNHVQVRPLGGCRDFESESQLQCAYVFQCDVHLSPLALEFTVSIETGLLLPGCAAVGRDIAGDMIVYLSGSRVGIGGASNQLRVVEVE